MTMRSTTTSTVCLSFFSSLISSSSSRTSPSTRTREKPSCRRSSKSFAYSPLRPSTTGASTSARLPWACARTLSATWSVVWRSMTRPHSGQCGVPTRAYSRRR